MSKIIRLQTPFSAEKALALHAGDQILLSGVIWTGRDAAHRRLIAALDAGTPLPVELRDQIIYFVGPCPAKPGEAIGSAGPTTSGRMDAYSPRLIRETGLRGMIGKGTRGPLVVEAMKEGGAVYFAATGGAGALIAKSIRKAEVVAFDDLGPEAIYRLEVENFPLVVAIDASGVNLYERKS
jgi:fumarate hydratase subunit beta